MAETYNSQRLHFVRDEKCYGSFQEILDYVVSPEYFMAYRQTEYGEPLLFKYGNEDKPNIVLAIGATNGSSTNFESNQLFFIDFNGLQERVANAEGKISSDHNKIEEIDGLLEKLRKACGIEESFEYSALSGDEILSSVTSLMEADSALSEAIISAKVELNTKIDDFKAEYDEHVAKSVLKPQETSSIVMTALEGTVEDGTVITADLKLPAEITLSKRVSKLGEAHTKNSLEILNDGHIADSHEGLFLNVSVTAENGKASLWVNNEEYDISTNGKFVESARYDYETECIVLEYNNGDEPVMINMESLINEWKVKPEEEQYSSGVVLKRQRVAAGPKDENQFSDILTAEIHVAEDALNMAEVVNDNANKRFGLFVSKQPIIDEVNRAAGIEKQLDEKIDTTKAELQATIDAETLRALGIEKALQDADDTTNTILSNLIKTVDTKTDGTAIPYLGVEVKYVKGENVRDDIKALDNALNDSDAAVETEVARATKVEEELKNAIGAEAETRANADSDLDAKIDVLGEAFESAKTTLTEAIATEADRAKTAESKLAQDIADLTISSDTMVVTDTDDHTKAHMDINKSFDHGYPVFTVTLKDVASENTLKTEIERATNAEEAIISDLTQEITDRKSADKSLTDSIETEVARATKVEEELKTNIAKVKQEAQTKITLENRFDAEGHMFLTMADTGDTYGQFVYTIGVKDVASAAGLASEIARATGEEVRIENKLNAEIDRSTGKDAEHDKHLDQLDSELAVEAKTRGDKDTELEKALKAEEERAIKAEQKAFVDFENTSTVEIIPKYKNDTEKVFTANVKVLEDENNVIKAGVGGVYANVTLDYDRTNNTLVFKNGTAGSKEIALSDHTLVQSAYYNKEKKAIILTVTYDNGTTKDIELPVADLVESITDVNKSLSDSIVELQRKDSEINSQITEIKNDVKDLDTDLILLENEVSIAKSDISSLKDKLDKEIADRQDGDSGLKKDIEGLNLTLTEEKTAREKDVTKLTSDLAEEVKDRTKAVSDLYELVTSDIATRDETDNRLEGLISAEATARQEADNNLRELINSAKNSFDVSISGLTSSTGESIALAKSDLESKITALDTKLSNQITSVSNEVNTLKTSKADASDVVRDIAAAKSDLQNQIATAKSDMNTQLAGAKSDLQNQINNTKTELQGKIDNLPNIYASKESIESLRDRILILEQAFQRLYNDGYVTTT